MGEGVAGKVFHGKLLAETLAYNPGQVLTYLFMSILYYKLELPFRVPIGSPYRPSRNLTVCSFSAALRSRHLIYALIDD